MTIKYEDVIKLNIPTKATQVLTFYKLAPLILGDIIVLDSPNYKPFKLMREIIMICFSKTISENGLVQLEDSVYKFLVTWRDMLSDTENFKPNHHFLTHLIDNIKTFGHPSEFSCLRYEAKHQVFKQISRKKHGFKNHLLTIVAVYNGKQNLNLQNVPIFLGAESLSFEKNDNAVIFWQERLVKLDYARNGKFSGKYLKEIGISRDLMALHVVVESNSVRGSLENYSNSIMMLVTSGNSQFVLLDHF